MNNIQKRMQELTKELKQYNYEYYVLDAPTVEDIEYEMYEYIEGCKTITYDITGKKPVYYKFENNLKISSKQINGAENNFMQGSIGGKDYIGMSPDSSIAYNLKKLKPGEEKELTIFVYINKNRNKCMLNELDDEVLTKFNGNIKEKTKFKIVIIANEIYVNNLFFDILEAYSCSVKNATEI